MYADLFILHLNLFIAMKKLLSISLATLFALAFYTTSFAQCHSATSARKATYKPNVVEIAVGSEVHTTLVAAVKAAGLVETLQGEGPFTIFAPTNDAFAKLPEGTVASLLEPENKAKLTDILTYHVIAGSLDSKAVVSAIEKGNGKAQVETLNGGKITAMLKDGNVVLQDENGRTATVTAVDLEGSNGVIHVIDTVVLPE